MTNAGENMHNGRVCNTLKITGSIPSTKKKRKETKTMLKGVYDIEEAWSWGGDSTV